MKIYGFKATTPLVARAIAVLASFFGLFFIYEIASMIRGRDTGSFSNPVRKRERRSGSPARTSVRPQSSPSTGKKQPGD